MLLFIFNGVCSKRTRKFNNNVSIFNFLGDDQLDAIFRKCFEDSTANYSTDDVAFAGNIIKELQRLPAVKPSIANRNMLITRVIYILSSNFCSKRSTLIFSFKFYSRTVIKSTRTYTYNASLVLILALIRHNS